MKPALLQHTIFFLLLCSSILKAQIPVQEWRDHLPYYKGSQIVEGTENVYCLADNNLFYYNKTDRSINKFSKIQGLSDVQMTVIAFSKKYNTLIIGYSSGNIDLVENKTIINLSDIERKNTIPVKSINRIYIDDNLAYLSTTFGIVVLDMVKKEFKDTYFIGDLGIMEEVFDIAIDNNYIYAATGNGIKKADKASSRLIDFNEWEEIKSFPAKGHKVSRLTNFNNTLFAIIQNTGHIDDTVYAQTNNTWSVWDKQEQSDYYSFVNINNSLVVSRRGRVQVYDENMKLTRELWIPDIQDAFLDDKAVLWMADQKKGMVINPQSNWKQFVSPLGPLYNSASDIQFSDGRLWVAAGGSKGLEKYQYRGAYFFENQKWTNINNKLTKGLTKFPNIYKIAIDPNDPSHMFAGSYGYGIAEFKDTIVVDSFYVDNSLIRNIESYGYSYALVSALDFAPNSYLYFCLSKIPNPFYVITNKGKMINYNFDFEDYGFDNEITDFIVTSHYHKWALIDGKGIFAFDDLDTPEDKSDDLERFFVVRDDDGKEVSNLKCIAEDLEGNIWIGTTEGPLVYYNPEDVFSDDPNVADIRAHRITLARNEGDDLADQLLVTETITDIEVDGGNRKWLGTENSGAYLFSKDGLTQIHHFNEDNSPLFSNKINSIGIDHKSGEVYFGTEKGLISFRGDATKGDDGFKDVYVFPNPIRENYEGIITITGLARDVNVKITNISGNIVYETQANGGTATWDGKNFAGHRVATGIYMVFCTDDKGDKTYVTKMLFIN